MAGERALGVSEDRCSNGITAESVQYNLLEKAQNCPTGPSLPEEGHGMRSFFLKAETLLDLLIDGLCVRPNTERR